MSIPLFSIRVRAPLARFGLEVELDSDARALGVFGPSGAGKTSLLECLAGWRRAQGRIALAGRVLQDSERGLALPIEARGIGYVPQEGLLFPHRSVRANLTSGERRGARTSAERTTLAQRVIAVLELEPLLERSPAALSGGERQRVALGRALCSAPDVLLLDEPLSGLDLALRRRILPHLIRIGEEFRLPMLYVSHDASEVGVLCEEVVLLREGRSVARGRPRDVFAETWRRELLEQAAENILRGRVHSVQADVAAVALDSGPEIAVPGAGLAPGERVVLAIRPDEILVARARPAQLSARNVLPARVARLEQAPAGVILRALLDPGDEPLDVLLTRGSTESLALAPGGAVFLVLKSNSVRVLSVLPG